MEYNTFYENNNFSLINGNCLSVLKDMEEKSVDMIFADPPYFLSGDGISCRSGKQVSVNKGEWDRVMKIDDKLEFNSEWIRECRRVLKDDGTIFISGTFHNIYAVGVALEKEGFSIINNITWQKPNPAPNLACRCFTNSTETILWARKVLNNKNKKGKHVFNYSLMKEMNGGKQMKDVWNLSLPKKEEKKFGYHPTQKPEGLLELIILCSTNENDLILDPFNGSGTTGIVANKLKRRYIGIDISQDYLNITLERLKGITNNE